MFDIDRHILIGKSLKHSICYTKVAYYCNNDMYYCPWQLRKTQFQTFYYIHIIEIPTIKGANCYNFKLSKIGNYPCKYSIMIKRYWLSKLTLIQTLPCQSVDGHTIQYKRSIPSIVSLAYRGSFYKSNNSSHRGFILVTRRHM